MKTLILYHDHCADGFGAAYLFWKTPEYADAEYVPVQYGQPAPDCTGRTVFILDFCYGEAEMAMIAAQAASVYVLDHHPTAKDVAGYYGKFDPDHSGAMMAWMYLNPGVKAPQFVRFLEDRDLWLWKMGNSREFSAGLQMLPFDFDTWDDYFSSITSLEGCSRLIADGRVILKYQAKIIASHVKNAVRRTIWGQRNIPTVNATTLISEIGNELCKGVPFSASYYDRLEDGMRIWSLRSDENGIDVGMLAKLVGGGGHKHAAGVPEKLP